MKYAALLTAVCVTVVLGAHAQDIDGLKLGMTENEVCNFVKNHSGYAIAADGCSQTENFVTVSVASRTQSIGSEVKLIFLNGKVHALWTVFPEADFAKASQQLVKRYGPPQVLWKMKAGSTRIIAGPAKQDVTGKFLLDSGMSQSEILPGSGPANFTNFYLYWRIHAAHVFLEQQNEKVDGQMTSWYAIIAPDTDIANSR